MDIDNTWFVNISCSVIATVIVAIIAKVFKPGWKIVIFSVFVSTIVFMFGNILQSAVHVFFEPDNPLWTSIAESRNDTPVIFILLIFVLGLLPGILTGVCCAIGRSLNQHIVYAIISSIISLSLVDTTIFFYLRRLYLQSEMPELKAYTNFGLYYFSLLSNLLGGLAAGIIIGYLTHLVRQQKTQ